MLWFSAEKALFRKIVENEDLYDSDDEEVQKKAMETIQRALTEYKKKWYLGKRNLRKLFVKSLGVPLRKIGIPALQENYHVKLSDALTEADCLDETFKDKMSNKSLSLAWTTVLAILIKHVYKDSIKVRSFLESSFAHEDAYPYPENCPARKDSHRGITRRLQVASPSNADEPEYDTPMGLSAAEKQSYPAAARVASSMDSAYKISGVIAAHASNTEGVDRKMKSIVTGLGNQVRMGNEMYNYDRTRSASVKANMGQAEAYKEELINIAHTTTITSAIDRMEMEQTRRAMHSAGMKVRANMLQLLDDFDPSETQRGEVTGRLTSIDALVQPLSSDKPEENEFPNEAPPPPPGSPPTFSRMRGSHC